jgi:hypothetical protein
MIYVGTGSLTLSQFGHCPDLNPLDYSFWNAVYKLLRAQEKKFDPSKTESRAKYEARLKRTIL